MKKGPKIYVVLEEFHDYGLRSCEPVAWFFDEDEADEWASAQGDSGYKHFRVEGVDPGDSETIEKERW